MRRRDVRRETSPTVRGLQVGLHVQIVTCRRYRVGLSPLSMVATLIQQAVSHALAGGATGCCNSH